MDVKNCFFKYKSQVITRMQLQWLYLSYWQTELLASHYFEMTMLGITLSTKRLVTDGLHLHWNMLIPWACTVCIHVSVFSLVNPVVSKWQQASIWNNAILVTMEVASDRLPWIKSLTVAPCDGNYSYPAKGGMTAHQSDETTGGGGGGSTRRGITCAGKRCPFWIDKTSYRIELSTTKGAPPPPPFDQTNTKMGHVAKTGIV